MRRRKRVRYFCTTHKLVQLEAQETRFGLRWSCPTDCCTVVLWDGSTSTPADYETRQARIEAHSWFDSLWQSGSYTRSGAYKALARYLRIPTRQTHIGHFDLKRCQQTIKYCRAHTELRMELNLDEFES